VSSCKPERERKEEEIFDVLKEERTSLSLLLVDCLYVRINI
jgi:hypothetical protein